MGRRVARSLLGVVSLLWLSVTAIFLLAVLNINAEVASPSLLFRDGLFLPYLGLIGTFGVDVGTVGAWRNGYWTGPTRLHYTLMTVVALVFARQLHYLRILAL